MTNVVVWGTGRKSKDLVSWFNLKNGLAVDIQGEAVCEISFFFDSYIDNDEGSFFGKPVYKPNKKSLQTLHQVVLIAVLHDEEITSMLEKYGLRAGQDYIRLPDIRKWFYQDLCFVRIVCEHIGLSFALFNNISDKQKKALALDELKSIWSRLSSFCADRNSTENWLALQDCLVLTIFTAQCTWENCDAISNWLLAQIGIPRYCALLEECFEGEMSDAAAWMPPASACSFCCGHKKTLGLYYMRYFNGGVERVLSQLMPMFIEQGYHIVFITDIIDIEKEYELPDGVVRVCLGDKISRRERTQKLLASLHNFHVGIFCCHAYAGRILYDVFAVRQAGISVLLEMHNSFISILQMMGEDALTLARYTDALVVLSRTDETFWRMLGCRAIYVPNPVEPPDVTTTLEPVPGTILCLQRIDQMQKQVYELPGIMAEVIKGFPEARLLLVGAADDAEIEKHLREMLDETGVSEHVEFLGFHKDVTPYYKQADVILMTSAYEGFPMVVAESKRYGIPLVMYELPYIEMLHDKRGYIAVPQHEQKQAAAALLRIINNRKLRQKLSIEAKESLAEFCSMDLMAMWRKAFALVKNEAEPVELSMKEQYFSLVERLLLEGWRQSPMPHSRR